MTDRGAQRGDDATDADADDGADARHADGDDAPDGDDERLRRLHDALDGRRHREHGDGRAHGHAHGADPPGVRRRVALALRALVALGAVATVVAVVVLRPGGDVGFEDPLLLDAEVGRATVVAADEGGCSYDPEARCVAVSFEVTSGPEAGSTGSIEQSAPGVLSVGDRIEVTSYDTESGDVAFAFYDFDRDGSMRWLLALFVVAVVALGRWRGVGALAGLAFSLLVIVVFTLPAVLDGRDAVWVALTTASLIAFAALFLAHGIGIGTVVALTSTLASLLVTAVLAWVFVGATELTGLGDESSNLLGGLAAGVDPRGILLAGIVIGSLGVLDDVTVTQVSAVWELKRARPELGTRELVAPALRIGRDHISSTVNTLFLAYAGAALPLLLLFTQAGQGLADVVTREIVATEVVRALVGSIGLVASVPVSTWLAALVVSGGATEAPADVA